MWSSYWYNSQNRKPFSAVLRFWLHTFGTLAAVYSCARKGIGYLKYMGILPSHQLLWFLTSIYLNPVFKPGFFTSTRYSNPDLTALSPKVFFRGAAICACIVKSKSY